MADLRQTWPAPERNRDPILAVLRETLPPSGVVLQPVEITRESNAT